MANYQTCAPLFLQRGTEELSDRSNRFGVTIEDRASIICYQSMMTLILYVVCTYTLFHLILDHRIMPSLPYNVYKKWPNSHHKLCSLKSHRCEQNNNNNTCLFILPE
uniref:Uncharacterized protein n=1 Tax=Cacopsylla melanoneura TaxID=428564 RepID=A0A8D8ZQH2_9HEMI